MLKWNGDAIKKKVLEAAKHGVDKTMSEAVIEAKRHHPGWKNVTGTAEGSINVVKFAEEEGQRVRGVWGSPDVDYMIWLELKHGSALRSSADKTYPRLQRHIKEAFR